MANAKANDPISVSLKYQLANLNKSRFREENDKEESSLDSSIIASVRRILECKVEFEKVPGYSSMVQENLKGKYKVLATPKKVNSELEGTSVGYKVKTSTDNCSRKQSDMGMSPKKGSVDSASRDSLSPPIPSTSLYPESAVKLGWEGNEPVGAGMINLGNTCYLNSTLQALFHVPSFCNWLSSETIHNGTGKCDQAFISGDMCTVCAMAATLRVSRAQTGSVIKPALIYGRLKSICKHLSHGHQEDAHEFLRFLIESMERTFLLRFKGKKLDNLTKETTPLHRIFGGYLRNEVTCHSCGRVSTTFQLFQDLFLDIRQSNTLLQSMQAFFSREKLEGDESKNSSYKCEKCMSKGNCTKRVYVQIPPKVLCIQLKRFTALGKKIMKHISYPIKLDLSPYVHVRMANQSNNSVSPLLKTRRPIPYKLVSVVSHYGTALNCGHYTAVGRSAKGSYYIFDDSQVRPVSLNSALVTSAYILMYEMEPGWQIGLENKGSHNMEKCGIVSSKTANSPVKFLASTNNFQKSQTIALGDSEVISSPSSKLISSFLLPNNRKMNNAPAVPKSLNLSSSSNAESNSRKPYHSKHEKLAFFSKGSQGKAKPMLNGLVSREVIVPKDQSARIISASEKGSCSLFTNSLSSEQTKQIPPVTQKQLLLPKMLNPQISSDGANVPSSKTNNVMQNLLQPSKSNQFLIEAPFTPSGHAKEQVFLMSQDSVSIKSAHQKDCPKKSRNVPVKRSLIEGSEENKQSTPVHKKQMSLPDFLNIKNNQFSENIKTSPPCKIRTLKDWLVDNKSLIGKRAENETKQLHQGVSTKSCSGRLAVISTVGGWKVTEHNSTFRGKPELGLKRKADMQEKVIHKKKRCVKVVNGGAQRTLSQNKTPFISTNGSGTKDKSIIRKDRHKGTINGASALNPFMIAVQQNVLFQKL